MASRRLDIGSLLSNDVEEDVVQDGEPPLKRARPDPAPSSPTSPKYTSTWPSALTTLATLAQVRSTMSSSTSPTSPPPMVFPRPLDLTSMTYSPPISGPSFDTDTSRISPPLPSPSTPRVIITPADSPSPPTPEHDLHSTPLKSEEPDDWLMSQAETPLSSRKVSTTPRESSPLAGRAWSKAKSHSPRHVTFSPEAESPTASPSRISLEPDMDVDSELLSLVDDPDSQYASSSTQPPPLLYSAPPMRQASKKSAATAKGFIPTITQTKKRGGGPKDTSATKTRGKSSSAKPTMRGRGRGASAAARGGRGRGGASLAETGRKTSAGKKNSLLVQAQENRARSLLHSTQKGDEPGTGEPEEDYERLYCLCKSHYDEERVMIGCDRCDEWYHPTCVQLKEVDVETIDVYVCPACRKQNPHLQITRKTSCKRPSCEKSARNSSKYCSDECGILCMKALLESKGLDKASLWEAVKDVRRPEGRTVSMAGSFLTQRQSWDLRLGLEMDDLKEKLGAIERDRLSLNKLLAAADARVALLDKAIAKTAEVNDHLLEADDQEDNEEGDGRKGECGWDVRLMWNEEEWAQGVADGSISEGYGDVPVQDQSWWCSEGMTCPRHSGWQKLQQTSVDKEKEMILEAMDSLTASERDIRMRMDAIHNPDLVPNKTKQEDQTPSPVENEPPPQAGRGSGGGRGGRGRWAGHKGTKTNGIANGTGSSTSRGRKKAHA